MDISALLNEICTGNSFEKSGSCGEGIVWHLRSVETSHREVALEFERAWRTIPTPF